MPKGKPLSAAHKKAIADGLKAFHKSGGKKRKTDHNAIANRANDVIIEYNGFLIDLETELPIYYTYLVVWQKQLGKLIAE